MAKTSLMRRGAAAVCALLIGNPALYVGTAWAQQGEPGVARLDTIEVTANKIVQSLQDVPNAITAYNAEDLETFRIASVKDLADVTPGLSSSPSPVDPGGERLVIRGIGNTDPQIGIDSKTAVYIDGVYFGRTQGVGFDATDLERVEVLRGPQGTLYGRNAVAGAINLINRQADPDMFAANATVGFGNYNSRELRGSVNMPVTRNFAIKAAGRYEARDGWVENTGLGEDFFGRDSLSLRLDTTFAPTDFLRLNYALDYSDAEIGAAYWQPVPGTARGPFAGAVPPVQGRADTARAVSPVENSTVETTAHTFTADWQYATEHALKVLVGYREVEATATAVAYPHFNLTAARQIWSTPSPQFGGQSLSQLFGPTLAAVANFAGSTLRPDYLAALQRPFVSAGATPDGGDIALDGHEQVSAEFTATGKFNDRFSYVAGLYYFDEQTGSRNAARPDDALALASLADLLSADINRDGAPDYPTAAGQLAAAAQLGCFGETPAPQCAALVPALRANAANTVATMGQLRNATSGDLYTTTSAYAAYGQMTYAITPNFRATLGARLSFDEKTGMGQRYSPVLDDTRDLMGRPIAPHTGEDTFGSFDPTFILEYDVSDEVMLYGKYTEGFRSGGYNQQAESQALFAFDKEEITAIEAGVRSEFLDRRARLNVNFYNHWLDDEQVFASNPANIFDRAIINTDSIYRGVEVDGALVFTPGLRLDAAYAWADVEQDDITNPFTGRTEKRTATFIPENSYRVGLNYQRPTTYGPIEANLSYSYKDETFLIDGGARDSQSLLDASLAYTWDNTAGPDVTVKVWGRNLLDDEYNVNYVTVGTFATDIEYFGPPRTFGLSLSTKF